MRKCLLTDDFTDNTDFLSAVALYSAIPTMSSGVRE